MENSALATPVSDTHTPVSQVASLSLAMGSLRWTILCTRGDMSSYRPQDSQGALGTKNVK